MSVDQVKAVEALLQDAAGFPDAGRQTPGEAPGVAVEKNLVVRHAEQISCGQDAPVAEPVGPVGGEGIDREGAVRRGGRLKIVVRLFRHGVLGQLQRFLPGGQHGLHG